MLISDSSLKVQICHKPIILAIPLSGPFHVAAEYLCPQVSWGRRIILPFRARFALTALDTSTAIRNPE